MLIVDGANVVGARPDGWWRDRAGAAGRLLRGLVALGEPAVLVLEGAARGGAPVGLTGLVEVVHAAGSGDDRIVELAGPGDIVVTADRLLRERVAARGADVGGPRGLLARIDAAASS